MIDKLVLLMIHFLLAVAFWRLLMRDELDADPDLSISEEAPMSERDMPEGNTRPGQHNA